MPELDRANELLASALYGADKNQVRAQWQKINWLVQNTTILRSQNENGTVGFHQHCDRSDTKKHNFFRRLVFFYSMCHQSDRRAYAGFVKGKPTRNLNFPGP
jgi:hypothetical protein